MRISLKAQSELVDALRSQLVDTELFSVVEVSEFKFSEGCTGLFANSWLKVQVRCLIAVRNQRFVINLKS